MKFLCSFLVGVFFFSFVHLGSFSPIMGQNEAHQKRHIPKDKLALIRHYVASLELKDLKDEGVIHHKVVKATENDEREPSIREQHFHIEAKREPFDYSGHQGYGRNGKRKTYSEKKSSKITKLEPLKNKDPSGTNEKRVSIQKQLQKVDDVMPDLPNVYNKHRESQAVEHDASSFGVNGNVKGFDSEFDDIYKSDFQNEN